MGVSNLFSLFVVLFRDFTDIFVQPAQRSWTHGSGQDCPTGTHEV
jgi:hypothetical protein